jgi:hypothetical protein
MKLVVERSLGKYTSGQLLVPDRCHLADFQMMSQPPTMPSATMTSTPN